MTILTLQQEAAKDFEDFILDIQEWGESIDYTPKGGVLKPINALIDRQPPEIDNGELGQMTVYRSQVWISTDATLGIASPGKEDRLVFDGRTHKVKVVDKETGVDQAILEVVSVPTAEREHTDGEIRRSVA